MKNGQFCLFNFFLYRNIYGLQLYSKGKDVGPETPVQQLTNHHYGLFEGILAAFLN